MLRSTLSGKGGLNGEKKTFFGVCVCVCVCVCVAVPLRSICACLTTVPASVAVVSVRVEHKKMLAF